MGLRCYRRFGFHLYFFDALLSVDLCSLTLSNYKRQALPTIRKELIEVLDILLKWFVLQFCKSNTTCLLKVWYPGSFFFLEVMKVQNMTLHYYAGKVLEFLPELFDALRDEGYSLTESEAAIFFPCLVEKVCLCLLYGCKVFSLSSLLMILLFYMLICKRKVNGLFQFLENRI